MIPTTTTTSSNAMRTGAWYHREHSGRVPRGRRALGLRRRGVEIARDEKISRVDLLLLGILANRGSSHGYEIGETLGGDATRIWIRLGRTSIYYALNRLAERGLVSQQSERRAGRPERRVYSITEAGRRACLAALQTAIREPDEPMDSFDIALFLSPHLPPDQFRARLDERLEIMRVMNRECAESLREARVAGHMESLLVLERRKVLLAANIDFIERLLGSLAQMVGDDRGRLAGDLAVTRLHEVLRSLATAGRTGILELPLGADKLRFRLHQGSLVSVHAPVAADLEGSLRQAFSSPDGHWVFADGEEVTSNGVDVGSVAALIMRGTRGVTSWDELRNMLPNPEAVLDVVAGSEFEILELDLEPIERRVLSELDGVRTLDELAGQLQLSAKEIASAAYPLWAAGWVVAADPGKRETARAVLAITRLWGEEVAVVGGARVRDSIFGGVSVAAGGAGLPDYWRALARPGLVRFAGDGTALAGKGRAYLQFVQRAVSVRLGPRFTAEMVRSIKKRLPADALRVVRANNLLPEEMATHPGGGKK